MKKHAYRRFKAYAASKERHRVTRLRRLTRRKQRARVFDAPASYEHRIVAPTHFALEEHFHDNLVSFLRQLRAAFLDGTKIVCVDFRATVLMVAGGTLLFYSELQRLKALFPSTPIRCVPSKDLVVNQVLQHLKIFEFFGYSSDVVPTRHDVVSWNQASSEEIDGDKVGLLLEKYKSLSGPVAGQLFRGAGEAMFNVRHAYLEARSDGLPPCELKKWWMFCRESDASIFVAVCDLGIGIPRSLPIKYPSEVIGALLAGLHGSQANNDAKMIHAAMEIRRTSTNRSGRGKGLKDFLRIIDHVAGAKLYIFSNRGLVTYSAGQYRRKTFQGSIKGTVVVWIVPLPKIEKPL